MKLIALAVCAALQLGSLDRPPTKNRQYVTYAGEQQTIPAGKAAILQLRFQVQDGFHINSHTPKSEYLIPTQVELPPTPGAKLGVAEYPAGKPFTLSIDPKETLDVYADAFVVKIPVTASHGQHEIQGSLKYQACDKALCYPPRTLPISIAFTAQ